VPRLRLRRTDEGETCHQRETWEPRLHIGFEANAVLDKHYERVLMQQRGQQRLQQTLVGGLQPDQHHIHGRHILCAGISVDSGEVEITIARGDPQPVDSDVLKVAMQEEMHFASGTRQFGSVEASDGTSANDGISQLSHIVLVLSAL
jgi:hypothetical protein